MAWDKNLPANTTQLRLGPGFQRANWDAIETGDSSLKVEKWNFAQRAGDPSLIASTFQLYSKSFDSKSEFFGINSDGDIVQFTKGSPTIQSNNGTSFIAGDDSAGVLLVAWGNITMTTSPSSTITPGFTTIYQYYISPVGNVDDNFATEGVGGNEFRVIRGSGVSSTTIRWLAIGV